MTGEIRMGFQPFGGGPVVDAHRRFLVLDSGATYALDNPTQVSAALAVPRVGSGPLGDALRQRVRELEGGLASGALVGVASDPLGQLVAAPVAGTGSLIMTGQALGGILVVAALVVAWKVLS